MQGDKNIAMDKRYSSIKERLETLTSEELKRIVSDINIVCFDTYNYDKQNKTYCPLAIAMNLHHTVKNPTDEKIQEAIGKRFMPVNIIKGLQGNFYRSNRKQDLLSVCHSILKLRNPSYCKICNDTCWSEDGDRCICVRRWDWGGGD